jgi:polyhydroxybutyrate depolymerase
MKRDTVFVGLAVIGLVLAVGWHERGLVMHVAFGGGKTAPTVVALDAGSTVLPKASAVATSTLPVVTAITGRVGPPRVEHLNIDGTNRSYVILLPDPMPPKPALVLVFHGDGGDGAGMHQGWPWENATHGDAILVYPDGLGATWTLGGDEPNRDLVFIDRLVAGLFLRFPLDRSRIYAAGYSSGGFFANVLACRRPGLLRAISSSAGGAPYSQASKYPNGYPKCAGETPVAAIALHGTQDFGVTIDSGEFTAMYWAYVDGCDMGEQETTGYAECHAYRQCPKGQGAVFCAVPGLGHWVWDRSAEVSWTFFQKLDQPATH